MTYPTIERSKADPNEHFLRIHAKGEVVEMLSTDELLRLRDLVMRYLQQVAPSR